MALDLGTLVAKVKVDDSDFDQKTSGWTGRGAAISSAFGNVAADAISQATQMLTEFVGEAANASDATYKFEQTLGFAGLDTSKIDMLREATQAYADQTVYNLGDIQQVTATLAANGVDGFETLAMSLGNLNAVAGGNAETFGRVGSVLTQTAGQGKLTTENWNQLTDAIPGASKKLMDALLNAGAYTGNFREAMEKGEISAEEFNAAIQEVGSDPIAVEAAKSVETFEGAQGNLAAAIQSQLVAALDMIKPAFTGLQNGMAWFIQNSGLLVPAIAALGTVLAIVLGPAIWAAVVATWAWTAALLANPVTWIVLAIGLLVGAIVWLIMNWDTAVAWITEVWGGFMTWIGEVIDGFIGWWNGVWEGFATWITGLWEGITTWISNVWNGFIGWIQGIIDGFVSWVSENWGLLLSFFIGPIGLAIQWVTENWGNIMTWFRAGLNSFLSFWSGLWNNVSTTVRNIWTGIIDWFKSIPGWIKGVFDGAINWLTQIGRDIINGLWNGLKEIAGNIVGWFEDTFGGIIDTVAGLFGIASPSRVFREFGQFIGQGLIEGLEEYEDPIDAEFRRMTEVPPIDVPPTDGPGDGNGGPGDGPEHWHYHAAPNASFDAQEEFFVAMGSPRVRS